MSCCHWSNQLFTLMVHTTATLHCHFMTSPRCQIFSDSGFSRLDMPAIAPMMETSPARDWLIAWDLGIEKTTFSLSLQRFGNTKGDGRHLPMTTISRPTGLLLLAKEKTESSTLFTRSAHNQEDSPQTRSVKDRVLYLVAPACAGAKDVPRCVRSLHSSSQP